MKKFSVTAVSESGAHESFVVFDLDVERAAAAAEVEASTKGLSVVSVVEKSVSAGVPATREIYAVEINPSDVLAFSDSEYKVRSVWVYSDRVEVVFWGVNGEQPYTYERSDVMRKVA